MNDSGKEELPELPVFPSDEEAPLRPQPFTKLHRRAGVKKGLYLAETKVQHTLFAALICLLPLSFAIFLLLTFSFPFSFSLVSFRGF